MTDEAPAVETPVEAPAAEPSGREAAGVIPDSFNVPEAFADKPWASNIKSQDDLYNQFDNLQGMIGKKSVPAADATDEQLDEFYTQIRPESFDKYELSLPEGIETNINDEVQGSYKAFFHKNGFSQKQAQALYEFHIQQELAGKPSQDALDAEFDSIMKDRYGDKANNAIKTAHKYLSDSDQATKDAFKDLPNNQMIAVIDVLNKNDARFSTEDGSPEGGEQTESTSIEGKVSEATKLRMSPEAKDPFHADHKATLAKLEALDADIQAKHK